MSFPSSPTNGQQAIVNGITYQYVSASNAWKKVVNNITTTTNVSGGVANQILYQTDVGLTNFIGAPTQADTYLRWSGSAFSWSTVVAGSSTTATTATNIAGGVANQIPYQTAAGITSFITAPTISSTFLQWNGSAFVWASAGGSFNGGTITNFLIISTSTQATTTNTGALQVVNGGAGIGGNLFVGGTASIAGLTTVTNTTNATSTNTGALQVRAGAGIGQNLFVGGITSIAGLTTVTNTTNATSTNTGALQVRGGAGIGLDLWVGGSLEASGTTNATSTNTGALQVIAGAGIGQNLFVGGITSIAGLTTVTNTTNATSTNTGALQVRGGAGIGQNLFVGGSITGTSIFVGPWAVSTASNVLTSPFAGIFTITNTTISTSTSTGALQVRGGVGVGGNLYVENLVSIGGLTTVTNVTAASSTNTGALQVRGGIGAGGTSYFGNNVYLSKDSQNFLFFVNSNVTTDYNNALYFKTTNPYANIPNASLLGELVVIDSLDTTKGGIRYFKSGSFIDLGLYANSFGSTSTANLLLRNDRAFLTTDLLISSSSSSTSTNTGALQVIAGAGIGQNLFVGGITSIAGLTTVTNTTNATSTNTGALQVRGGAGIGLDLWVGGLTSIAGLTTVTNTTNAISTDTGALQVRGGIAVSRDVYIGNSSSFTLVNPAITTASGAMEITGNSAGTNLPPNNSGVMLHITGISSQPGRIYLDGQGSGNYAAYIGRHYNGTTAAPTGLVANDIIMRVGGTPYTTGGWAAISNVRMDYMSDELQTTSTQGNRIEFWYTPVGSTSSNITRALVIGTTGTIITSTSATNSTQTGALQVVGGVGVGGDVTVGGTIFGKITSVAGGAQNRILYQTGTDFTGFIDSPTIAETFLKWNGTAFTWEATGGTWNGGTITNALTISTTTQSVSTNTGALVVTGGVGIGGNLYVGGTINGSLNITSNTATNVSGGAANQIVYQTNTGTTGFITAPTQTDTYLRWAGSSFAWSLLTTTGRYIQTRYLTSGTTTYTPTTGTTMILLEMVGSGGGGGGADTQYAVAAGGGAGGYARRLITNIRSTITYTCFVGAGAAGGAATGTAGSTGTWTTFTTDAVAVPANTTIIARGGGGGAGNAVGGTKAYYAGGAGGTASNGDINFDGQGGGVSMTRGGTEGAMSGAGGSTPFGSGGRQLIWVTADQAGVAGSGYGAGGGGAAANSATGAAGGRGADGIIVIHEFT